MNKTIFAISDIHGFYDETINALNDAGYDENNPNHLLVVLGDIFDRGEQSSQIFEWLYRLTKEGKAVVTKGNHDRFLIRFLRGDNDPFDFIHNGLNTTLDDFLHSTNDFGMFVCMNTEPNEDGNYMPNQKLFSQWAEQARLSIYEEYPQLVEWLEERPDYLETEHFIFTHASIDTRVDDWRHPQKSIGRYDGWSACHWDDGSFFGESICNTDKTVVIGHFGTYHLRKMYGIDDKRNTDHDILVREDKRIIALDTTTVLSGGVNVLKIEDENILN